MKAVAASPEERADHSKTVWPARERVSSLSVPIPYGAVRLIAGSRRNKA
jgi:hypothetical protein